MRRPRLPFRTVLSRWPDGRADDPTRRVAVAAVLVTVLITAAALAAWLTGLGDRPVRTPPAPSPTPSAASPPSLPRPLTDRPRTTNPLDFGEATARMLWTYDTRRITRDQHLKAVRAWMTGEDRYADWPSVSAQVPDPVLWARMRDQDQHASARIHQAHYPAAFKKAVADDPAALKTAHVFAVTVTGTQAISWKGGGAGAEDRTVTLAVQCRPDRDCALAALAPQPVP